MSSYNYSILLGFFENLSMYLLVFLFDFLFYPICKASYNLKKVPCKENYRISIILLKAWQ